MPVGTITAIAYLITELVSAGMKITEVMAEVQKTGVVPQAEWNALKADFDDAEKFWGVE